MFAKSLRNDFKIVGNTLTPLSNVDTKLEAFR